jgi:drug/metabolite transporter (DMT)-like permease
MAGLGLVVLGWSGNAIVGKIVLAEASPVLVSLVRFTLTGLLFYLPIFLLGHRGSRRFSRQEWPWLILLGAAGSAGSQVLFMLGLHSTSATEAGIYQITTPIFVVIIAWFWLGERLSRTRLAGIAVAALGATVLVSGGGVVGLGSDLIGALLILFSNFCWAGYTVLSKRLVARRSPLLVLTVANLSATVAIWLVAWLLGVLPELPSVARWSPAAWASMAYLVVVVATSSQWLYVWTIRELGPSRTSAGLYVKPLFVMLLASAILGEVPTIVTVISGLLILGGVWLVNRPPRLRGAAPADSRLAPARRAP